MCNILFISNLIFALLIVCLLIRICILSEKLSTQKRDTEYIKHETNKSILEAKRIADLHKNLIRMLKQDEDNHGIK